MYRHLSGNLGCYLGNHNVIPFLVHVSSRKYKCWVLSSIVSNMGFFQHTKTNSLKCFITSPCFAYFLENDIIPSFYVTKLHSLLYAQDFPLPSKLRKTARVHKSVIVKCDQETQMCRYFCNEPPHLSFEFLLILLQQAVLLFLENIPKGGIGGSHGNSISSFLE